MAQVTMKVQPIIDLAAVQLESTEQTTDFLKVGEHQYRTSPPAPITLHQDLRWEPARIPPTATHFSYVYPSAAAEATASIVGPLGAWVYFHRNHKKRNVVDQLNRIFSQAVPPLNTREETPPGTLWFLTKPTSVAVPNPTPMPLNNHVRELLLGEHQPAARWFSWEPPSGGGHGRFLFFAESNTVVATSVVQDPGSRPLPDGLGAAPQVFSRGARPCEAPQAAAVLRRPGLHIETTASREHAASDGRPLGVDLFADLGIPVVAPGEEHAKGGRRGATHRQPAADDFQHEHQRQTKTRTAPQPPRKACSSQEEEHGEHSPLVECHIKGAQFKAYPPHALSLLCQLAEQRKLVLWVGAGGSMGWTAKVTGREAPVTMPNWAQLVEAVFVKYKLLCPGLHEDFDAFRKRHQSLSSDWLTEAMETMRPVLDQSTLASVIEELFDKVLSRLPKEVPKWKSDTSSDETRIAALEQKIQAEDNQRAKEHLEVKEWRESVSYWLAHGPWRGIITTNYDDCIERGWDEFRYYTGEQLRYRQQMPVSHRKDAEVFFARMKAGMQPPPLLKVHGSLAEEGRQEIVLGYRDFRKICAATPKLTQLMHTLLSGYSFLFYGSSLSDEDLLRWLEYLAEHLGPAMGPHFWFTYYDEKVGDRKGRFNTLLKKYNIYTVEFTNKDEIPLGLRQVSEAGWHLSTSVQGTKQGAPFKAMSIPFIKHGGWDVTVELCAMGIPGSHPDPNWSSTDKSRSNTEVHIGVPVSSDKQHDWEHAHLLGFHCGLGEEENFVGPNGMKLWPGSPMDVVGPAVGVLAVPVMLPFAMCDYAWLCNPWGDEQVLTAANIYSVTKTLLERILRQHTDKTTTELWLPLFGGSVLTNEASLAPMLAAVGSALSSFGGYTTVAQGRTLRVKFFLLQSGRFPTELNTRLLSDIQTNTFSAREMLTAGAEGSFVLTCALVGPQGNVHIVKLFISEKGKGLEELTLSHLLDALSLFETHNDAQTRVRVHPPDSDPFDVDEFTRRQPLLELGLHPGMVLRITCSPLPHAWLLKILNDEVQRSPQRELLQDRALQSAVAYHQDAGLAYFSLLEMLLSWALRCLASTGSGVPSADELSFALHAARAATGAAGEVAQKCGSVTLPVNTPDPCKVLSSTSQELQTDLHTCLQELQSIRGKHIRERLRRSPHEVELLAEFLSTQPEPQTGVDQLPIPILTDEPETLRLRASLLYARTRGEAQNQQELITSGEPLKGLHRRYPFYTELLGVCAREAMRHYYPGGEDRMERALHQLKYWLDPSRVTAIAEGNKANVIADMTRRGQQYNSLLHELSHVRDQKRWDTRLQPFPMPGQAPLGRSGASV